MACSVRPARNCSFIHLSHSCSILLSPLSVALLLVGVGCSSQPRSCFGRFSVVISGEFRHFAVNGITVSQVSSETQPYSETNGATQEPITRTVGSRSKALQQPADADHLHSETLNRKTPDCAQNTALLIENRLFEVPQQVDVPATAAIETVSEAPNQSKR